VTSAFPDAGYSRRIVLVLSESQIEQCHFIEGGSDLLRNPELAMLPLPVPPALADHPTVRRIEEADLLRPGMMLAQSPFDQDEYTNVELAAERFALDKHMLFSQVCSLLGAVRVSVHDVSVEDLERSLKGGVAAAGLLRQGGVEVAAELQQRLKQELRLDDTFAGGRPDVAGARRLVQSHRLAADPTISSLVRLREENGNPLTSRRLQVNLLRESRKVLQAVGKLSLGFPKFLDVDVDLSVASYGSLECVTETEVDFA
jgi:hypothetical protein